MNTSKQTVKIGNKEFKLHKRRAFDVMKLDGMRVVPLIRYSILVSDSVKLNYWRLARWYFERKNNPKNLLKLLSTKEIFESAREILRLEGSKEKNLLELKILLNEATEKEEKEYLGKIAEYTKELEKLKKKATQSTE